MFTPLFSNGWYKRDKETTRNLVFSKNYTAAQVAINQLITALEDRLNTLPVDNQERIDLINAETLGHLQHAKTHIDHVKAKLDAGKPYYFDDVNRDTRTLRILDEHITVI